MPAVKNAVKPAFPICLNRIYPIELFRTTYVYSIGLTKTDLNQSAIKRKEISVRNLKIKITCKSALFWF